MSNDGEDTGGSGTSDHDSSDRDRPGGASPDDTGRYFKGEKGRTVPRSAWWVLGVALVLLAGFIVVRPSWFTKDVDDTSLEVPPERHFAKTLAGSGHADGVWLTDDSPSTSYLVTLPADSGRDETRLHLTGSTQVAADSTVFLVVSMDGQQVSKTQLATGDNPLDTFVDVPDQAAGDGRVRVQVRAEGTRHDETCTPDHSAGMQVHLDPASVLEAALDQPIHTVRDTVASWDRALTVVLTDRGDQWRTTAAYLGMALTRAGHDVSYTDSPPDGDLRNTILLGPAATLTEATGWRPVDGDAAAVTVGRIDGAPVLGLVEPRGDLLSTFLTEPTVATADSDTADPRAVTPATPGGDQVPLASLGADMSRGQITETRRWRVGYSLADLPGGRAPASVRVAVQLPDSPDDLTWLLNTDLNGRFLGSQRLNATGGVATIDLPPADQLLDNTLTLTVQRDRDLGGCNVRVTSYPIQLRGESALQLGDDPGAGFTALPRQLAPGFAVSLPDATEANAVEQLNAVTPVLTDFVPAQYDPEFRWGGQPAPGQPFILVGDSPDVAPPVRLADGRIVAGPDPTPLDISAFDTGLVVETATGTGGAPGLVVQYAGDAGAVRLPDFGRESAQIVTSQGAIVVNPDGTIAPTTPVRRDAPR
ncbi:hypothetical protein ACFWPA_06890 [Rhodococcus sp. NPDC058505]|uniref:hypothetical protein n=1 Tax=unclassified Rhodococcus (in: high G+C Gram-positive bacteria) TaxID=192944 RepID=UPI00365AC79C